MSKMIFVNLPVADLAATTRFYEAIGCAKNEQFSDDKAVSMMWSDTVVFMLLKEEYFATFTPKQVTDARRSIADAETRLRTSAARASRISVW